MFFEVVFLMDHQKFAPGFRFSQLDTLILIAGFIASTGVAFVQLWIGVAIGFVVVHFFLFCNIFRLPRKPELLWAAVFAVLGLMAGGGWLSWPVVFLCSFLAAVLLILVHTRHPSYHGVGWKSINPQLPRWWEAHCALKDRS